VKRTFDSWHRKLERSELAFAELKVDNVELLVELENTLTVKS